MSGSSRNEGASIFKFKVRRGFFNISIAVPDTPDNHALLRQLQEIANRDFFSHRSKRGALNRLTLQSWRDFRDQHYKGNPQKLLDVKPVISEVERGRKKWSKCDKKAIFQKEFYCSSPRYAGARGRLAKVGPDFKACANCTRETKKR